jgi:hypothetical protein
MIMAIGRVAVVDVCSPPGRLAGVNLGECWPIGADLG